MLTQNDLNQFCGSDQLHAHWLRAFVFTDGVKYLADKGNAYWLLDTIASHQPALLRQNPMLADFQSWKLTVTDRKGILYCGVDGDKLVEVQKIPFTDFPLPQVQLFLIDKILLLPSEY